MVLRISTSITTLLFFFLATTAASAQSTLAAMLYNKDLPQAIYDKKVQEGETAAREFFAALKTNDVKSLEAYLASKTTYQEIVAVYPYENETKREQAKRDVEAGHAKLVEELRANFQEMREQIKKAGVNIAELEVSQVKFTLKDHETMRGGRFTLELKDKNGKIVYLRLNSFYEFGGKWYMLGKGKLKAVNSDFTTPQATPAKG